MGEGRKAAASINEYLSKYNCEFYWFLRSKNGSIATKVKLGSKRKLAAIFEQVIRLNPRGMLEDDRNILSDPSRASGILWFDNLG